MVKLFGPALGTKASGTIGDAVTFSSWKGRAYAKSRALPQDPRSPAQVSHRAMMTFLAAEWQNFSDERKATWSNPDRDSHFAPYNFYLATNMDRWAQLKSPGMTFPVDESTSDGTKGPYPIYYPLPVAINVRCRLFVQADNWGFHLFRGDRYNFPITVGGHIATFHLDSTHSIYYVLRGQPAGEHWYCAKLFSKTGTGDTSTNRYRIHTTPFA